MSINKHVIRAVPTNIVTGFLGVGKTTVILNLLKQKPASERWAVLVNEFGQVGIDGALMQGLHSQQQGIYIREVPGGCMCCAAGLPLHIALNQLLAKAKPDRLIIEPTGLGHPKEVLELLTAEHYQSVLDIQHCITLVDARNLSNARYTNHDIFNQQIDIADIIIGHKADLYGEAAKNDLTRYMAKRKTPNQQSPNQQSPVPIYFVAKGKVDLAILHGPSAAANRQTQIHHHHHHANPSTSTQAIDVNEQAIPECGYLKISNSGDGYQSLGWRFAPHKIFNRIALNHWLAQVNAERIKGVFITKEGIWGYNITPDSFTEVALDDCLESRIEIITHDNGPLSEAGLLRCIEPV